MPTMWGEQIWKLTEARRNAYAQKLLAKGIIKNSNKWRTLMCRKGL